MHMDPTAAKKLKMGGKILVVGTLPLLLYLMMGPKEGNPVGLGILMWLSWLIGGVQLVRGTIGVVVAYLRDKRPS